MYAFNPDCVRQGQKTKDYILSKDAVIGTSTLLAIMLLATIAFRMFFKGRSRLNRRPMRLEKRVARLNDTADRLAIDAALLDMWLKTYSEAQQVPFSPLSPLKNIFKSARYPSSPRIKLLKFDWKRPFRFNLGKGQKLPH